jgi:hypothetical protein
MRLAEENIMIVCGHSTVEPAKEGWKVLIDEKVGDALSFFPGQTLFGVEEKGSQRLFISSLKLTPRTIYYRVFLEDVRGSLASMTALFSDRGVNILSGGAFGFGNIWVSEFIADFQGVDADPDAIAQEIMGMGGFVTSREITELFPRAFELTKTYRIEGSKEEGLYLHLPTLPGGTRGALLPRGGETREDHCQAQRRPGQPQQTRRLDGDPGEPQRHRRATPRRVCRSLDELRYAHGGIAG